MTSQRPLLVPYRSIGLFIDENRPHLFHIGKKAYMLASTSHSFKLYKLPEMKVKLIGPNLPKKIRAVTAHNENIFLACGNQIYHFEYYHLVNIYTKVKGKISCMLNVGEIIIVGDHEGEIVVFDFSHADSDIARFTVGFNPLQIVHPTTYLNKILILGERNLELRNIRTTQQIYDFSNENSALTNYLEENIQGKDSYIIDESIEKQKNITRTTGLSFLTIQNSPALDIVGIGVSNGDILLLHLKQDKVVQKFQLKEARAVSLAFSNADIPLLAVGDDRGDITVFNLNEQKVFSIIKSAHKQVVNYVDFMKEDLVLISGSYNNNNVLFWQYDELEETKFRLIRKRCGLSAPIKKLGFYGDEGYHVIASSFSPDAEIKDYFLWNEAFEGNFSLKKNKGLQKLSFNTENIQETSQILDFGFSSNRAKDWSNLLTSHKNFDKPYLWSTEDHTLVKKDIKWESDVAKAQITKVFATLCGNFGILGYENGQIIKINMQSGIIQKVFQKKKVEVHKKFSNLINTEKIHCNPITGVFVDSYNKVLVSADSEGNLANWDFFSGTLQNYLKVNSKITLLKSSKISSLFAVVTDDHIIELYDQYTFNKARVFKGHKNRVMDVCFTVNGKQVVSSSLDCTIKIWDIIAGMMVNNLKLKTPIVSLDFDPSGDFLVTAFANSKEIFIWTNKIGREIMGNSDPIDTRFVSKLNQKEWGTSRKKYIQDQESKEIQVEQFDDKEIDDLKKFLVSCVDEEEVAEKEQMIGFFEEDIGRWVPLVHLDEIKEKNKPKEKVESNPVAPFFLEFDTRVQELNSKMEGKIEEEKQPTKKSKIIKNNERNEFLEQVGSNLEKLTTKLIEEGASDSLYNEIFLQMKRLNPSQYDYELRKITFGNIETITSLLDFFGFLFKDSGEHDLKQIYFCGFLNICSDILVTNTELLEKVSDIEQSLKIHWENLNEQILKNTCMIEHFAKIKN